MWVCVHSVSQQIFTEQLMCARSTIGAETYLYLCHQHLVQCLVCNMGHMLFAMLLLSLAGVQSGGHVWVCGTDLLSVPGPN